MSNKRTVYWSVAYFWGLGHRAAGHARWVTCQVGGGNGGRNIGHALLVPGIEGGVEKWTICCPVSSCYFGG